MKAITGRTRGKGAVGAVATGVRGAEIRVHGLAHTYSTRERRLPVLIDVNFAVAAGEYVAISGPSGAGKTTLLAMLGGLERPQVGSVSVAGEDLGALRGDGLAAFRRETVGFVFQHFGLLEALTAAENVELASSLAGHPRALRRAVARDVLDRVGLSDRARHRPVQLSGGERQRVAIARALANSPRLVLADEPTGNLDEDSAEQVVELLEAVAVEQGCTLVVVTHNNRLAQRASTRYVLRDGALNPV